MKKVHILLMLLGAAASLSVQADEGKKFSDRNEYQSQQQGNNGWQNQNQNQNQNLDQYQDQYRQQSTESYDHRSQERGNSSFGHGGGAGRGR